MNYVPLKLGDLIGRIDEINKIKKWLKGFYKKDSDQKNALLIEGCSGIAKSILIEYILEDLQFDTYRIDGCEFKNTKVFRDQCNNIMHTKNVMMMFNKNIKKAIFIDELEAIISTDKSIVSEIILIINENNAKKRGRAKKTSLIRNSNPIICVCQPIKNKKVKELMADCDVITLNPIPEFQLYEFINGIMIKEEREINSVQIYDIIKKTNGDIRKIFEILQNILSLSNKKIKDIDINNFNKKEIDLSINNIIESIYKKKGLTPDDMLYYFDHDKVNIPLVYYENVINYVETSKTNYYDGLEKAYHSMSDANVMESYIFNDQKWQLNNYFCVNSLMYPKYILGQINNKRSPKPFFIKFSIVLSKTSLRYFNIKILKTIADKMGIYIDEFYDTVLYYINLLKNKKYEKVMFLNKLYHIEPSDLEKMIKLYYSDCDLSKEIKAGLKIISC